MNLPKTGIIQKIEDRMGSLDPRSFRYEVLDAAKRFKACWIELGRYLVSVNQDKMFKEWGYLTFEAYCLKEVGIRKNTAFKLLKSYSFLEKEEPTFLQKHSQDQEEAPRPSEIPTYESVNTLRLAKQNSRVSEEDYETLREDVLDNVREESEVKKKARYILKNSPQDPSKSNPEEKKQLLIKKLIHGLAIAKSQMQELSFPEKAVDEAEQLLETLSQLQE